MKGILVLTLFVSSITSFSLYGEMEKCSDVLALGFYEKTQIQRTGNTTQDVLNWLKSDNFKKFMKTNSSGFGLDIPLGSGLSFGFSNNSDDKKYEELKERLDKGNHSFYNSAFSENIMQQVVNKLIPTAWQECMKNKLVYQAGGLIADIDMQRGDNFFLILKWQPRFNINSGKIESVTVSGATYDQTLKANIVIGTEWKTFMFTRQGDGEVSIAINLADNNGSVHRILPKREISSEKTLKALCLEGNPAALKKIDEESDKIEAQATPDQSEEVMCEIKRRVLFYMDLAVAVDQLMEFKGKFGDTSEQANAVKFRIRQIFFSLIMPSNGCSSNLGKPIPRPNLPAGEPIVR